MSVIPKNIRQYQWISVKDSLPESGVEVIAFFPKGTSTNEIEPIVSTGRVVVDALCSREGAKATHWKPMPPFPKGFGYFTEAPTIDDICKKYQVNRDGTIINIKRQTLALGKLKKDGYLVLTISTGGRYKYLAIHRMVAIVHVPNPENNPCVNHINGIKTDNRADNLEWLTHKGNTNHSIKNKLQRPNKGKPDLLSNEEVYSIRNMLKSGYSRDYVAKKVKRSVYVIDSIRAGNTYTQA